MSTTTEIDVQIDEKVEKRSSFPPKYKVIFLNDDVTPIDWVISLLVKIFKHPAKQAEQIALSIHNEGSGVAGVYNYEIAEQKSLEATAQSREQGFPLLIKVERDI